MDRPGRHRAEIKTADHPADTLQGEVHVKAALDPVPDVANRPARRRAGVRVRAGIHPGHERRLLTAVQLRRTSRAGRIAQALNTRCVMAHNPVTQGLNINPDTPRHPGAGQGVLNHQRQRPQAAPARAMLVRQRQLAQAFSSVVGARHSDFRRQGTSLCFLDNYRTEDSHTDHTQRVRYKCKSFARVSTWLVWY